MIMFAIAFGVGLAAMKKAGKRDLWQVNAIDLILQQVCGCLGRLSTLPAMIGCLRTSR
jgi:hypothetical protein